jgi:hypothetical protein
MFTRCLLGTATFRSQGAGTPALPRLGCADIVTPPSSVGLLDQIGHCRIPTAVPLSHPLISHRKVRASARVLPGLRRRH